MSNLPGTSLQYAGRLHTRCKSPGFHASHCSNATETDK